jgi:hypothetical protein
MPDINVAALRIFWGCPAKSAPKFEIGNGEWEMGNGKWEMGNGKFC